MLCIDDSDGMLRPLLSRGAGSGGGRRTAAGCFGLQDMISMCSVCSVGQPCLFLSLQADLVNGVDNPLLAD
jgi:hypothetical protein